MEYRISKRFTMASEITERTLMIGEAFGISLDDEQTFTIYDDFAVNIDQGDVVYITGDSGSGKSLLLRELRRLVPNSISTADFQIADEVTIINGVGKTVEEALFYLSIVGLNDAFVFLRKYGELSDGQKYRFQLAKLLESEADAWFIDEFCAVLDRETARVVSFNMQKLARKFGKTLVVATTHGDLVADLSPSVMVRKGLENDVGATYPAVPADRVCSVVGDLRLVEGTLADYKVLSRFHYRSKSVHAVTRIWTYKKGEEVVGVIVYVCPPLALAGRNKFTDRYKATSSEVAHRLNAEVALISRVVLHPKYRGIGLGARIIRETMPLTGKRYVEALTVMGRFNPFNERAGLRRIPYEAPDRMKKVRSELVRLGWDMAVASSRAYNLSKLAELDEPTYRALTTAILYRVRDGKRGGLYGGKNNEKRRRMVEMTADNVSMAEVAEIIKEFVPKEKVYLVWENPEWRASA